MTQLRAPHLDTILPYLPFLIPYTIVYLSYYPSTRWLRLGLWPIGALAAYASLGRVGTTDTDMRLACLMMPFNFRASIHYALATSPPQIHPLPREPLFYRLRQYRPIQVIDLLIGDYRRINIAPNPPLKPGRPYFRAVLYHFSKGLACLSLFDALLLIVVRLSPDVFGSPNMVQGDFLAWTKDLGAQSGIPWIIIWTGLAYAMMIGGVIASMEGGYHMIAGMTIALGLYVDEEWPKMFGKWWNCSSLNEFWGKEYHQILRGMLLFWSEPFAKVSRSIHILATFFISTLVHWYDFYPITYRFSPWPTAIFFMGQGMGCVMERYLFKSHGIRIGGIWGRLWAFTWFTLTVAPLVNEQYGAGFAGGLRRDYTTKPETSLVEWGLYALGGKSPLEGRAVKV